MHGLPGDAIPAGDLGDRCSRDDFHDCVIALLHDAQLHEHGLATLRRELGHGGHAQAGGVKHQVKLLWARSTGVRNELGELLGWFHVSEGLAGAVVQAAGDPGDVGGGMDR